MIIVAFKFKSSDHADRVIDSMDPPVVVGAIKLFPSDIDFHHHSYFRGLSFLITNFFDIASQLTNYQHIVIFQLNIGPDFI